MPEGILFVLMASPTGFEPAANRSGGDPSIQLRYGDKLNCFKCCYIILAQTIAVLKHKFKNTDIFYKQMASPTGVEPATDRLGGGSSILLRYGDNYTLNKPLNFSIFSMEFKE